MSQRDIKRGKICWMPCIKIVLCYKSNHNCVRFSNHCFCFCFRWMFSYILVRQSMYLQVLTISANDSDAGENARVTYKISIPQKKFIIEGEAYLAPSRGLKQLYALTFNVDQRRWLNFPCLSIDESSNFWIRIEKNSNGICLWFQFLISIA